MELKKLCVFRFQTHTNKKGIIGKRKDAKFY